MLSPGDELLVTDNAYEPTRAISRRLLKRIGACRTASSIRSTWPGSLPRSAPKTRAVLLESPGSLTMEVCDVPALAASPPRRAELAVLLDNTWATSLGFRGAGAWRGHLDAWR